MLGDDRIVEARLLSRNGYISHFGPPLACFGAHARSRFSTE